MKDWTGPVARSQASASPMARDGSFTDRRDAHSEGHWPKALAGSECRKELPIWGVSICKHGDAVEVPFGMNLAAM